MKHYGRAELTRQKKISEAKQRLARLEASLASMQAEAERIKARNAEIRRQLDAIANAIAARQFVHTQNFNA